MVYGAKDFGTSALDVIKGFVLMYDLYTLILPCINAVREIRAPLIFHTWLGKKVCNLPVESEPTLTFLPDKAHFQIFSHFSNFSNLTCLVFMKKICMK